MPSLAELKASSPAYAAMPDGEFARRVYDRYYAGKMDYSQFAQKTGAPDDFAGVTSSAETFPTPATNGTADTGIGRLISGRQQEPSFLDSAGREIGLGARSMMRGAYGIPGIVLDPIMSAAGGQTSAQAAEAHADALGLPSPQTASERVGGDITSAVTGGGGVMQAGRALAAGAPGIAQGVGNILAAMPKTQVASLVGGAGASGITREAGGGEGAQLTAGLIGGLSPAVAATLGPMALRGALRGGEAGRQAMAANIENFRASGTTPSVGQATGNRRTQAMETFLANVPGGAGPMARKATSEAGQVGSRIDELAGNLAPGRGGLSPQAAGASVQEGAKTYAGNVAARRKALYWAADKMIPDSVSLPLTRTQTALAQLTSLTPGAESTTAVLINPKIAQLAKTVGEDLLAARAAGVGGIPYPAVKALRTRIGEEAFDSSLATDRPTKEYKRLYAALSQDMEEAARRQGPGAEAAVKRANNYYKLTEKRLEQLDRAIDKSGGPEYVYNALYSGAQQGATTLRAVMQSIPQESQRDFTAAVLRQMGKATPGQQNAATDTFSMSTFLTNWARLRPESRKVLFDRHGANFSKNMDSIAKMASNVREGSKVFANPSGTGRITALIGGISGTASTIGTLLATGHPGLAAGAAGAAAAIYGGTNWLARKMTDPKFVGWLANSSSLPVAAIPAQAHMLRQIGERDGDPDYIEAADWLEQNQPQRVQGETDQRRRAANNQQN